MNLMNIQESRTAPIEPFTTDVEKIWSRTDSRTYRSHH
jgi:hypothetical protein